MTGFHLVEKVSGTKYQLHSSEPFTYINTMSEGIKWTANLIQAFNMSTPENTVFQLKITVNDIPVWTSLDLVVQPARTKLFTSQSSISGIDYASYILSEDGTDHGTYVNQYSDDIMEAIAGEEVTIENAPHYLIPRYHADSGKKIEHISEILKAAGMCYYISTAGHLVCIDMDQVTTNNNSNSWIRDVEYYRDPTKKYTSVRIVKVSPVQTNYEFTYTTSGFKTEQFNAAMRSVQPSDDSVTGYCDEFAFFDNANINVGAQVGDVQLLYPELHEGANYPDGTSPGPVWAVTFNVYPPTYDPDRTDLDVRVLFEGSLEDDNSNNDLDFDCTAVTGESPVRPAPSCIDGTLIPTEVYANSIGKRMLYDLIKGCKGINFSGPGIRTDYVPGMEMVYPGVDDSRIESVSISRSGTQLTCYPQPWW